MSIDIEPTEVLVCQCGHAFPPEDAGGRIFECSRCSSQEVVEEGERGRCSECNIFTAKVADISCPECEAEIEDEEPVERYLHDGEVFETLEAVQEYEDGYEEREAASAAAAAHTAAMLAQHRLHAQERREALQLAVESYGKPLAYYGSRADDSMYWDSHSMTLSAAELMDLTATTDILDALRVANVFEAEYHAQEQPRQAFVLPNMIELDSRSDWDYYPREIERIRKRDDFTLDVPVLLRLIKAHNKARDVR